MMNNFGPLVGSGALYSAIGIVELAAVAAMIVSQWNGTLESISDTLHGCQL